MYEPADILEAARSIRPYLPDLVGEPTADHLDQQLADLLTQTDTQPPIDNRILEILAAQDITRDWLAGFLQDKQQPDALRSWSPLPGDPSMVSAPKFVCPQGDYVWHRLRVGIESPRCPTHDVPLERVS